MLLLRKPSTECTSSAARVTPGPCPASCMAFPGASAAGPQLGLAHRALLPQGTTRIFPLLGFLNFPAVHCSCLWWPLVLCQPLPLAQHYPHPRAPALHISCAVRPILLPLHSYQIPEWSRVPREWSEVVFCLQRACPAHLHLPLLQLTCCRSWGAAGLSGKHAWCPAQVNGG